MYIISPIILSFYVKYPDRITPTGPLWVNIALSWMRSLMHTASSGKTVYASMCHLGLCVFLCVSVLACVQIAYVFVCFSVCHSSSHIHAYGCLIVCVCVLFPSLAGFPLQHPLATSPPSPINREAVI